MAKTPQARPRTAVPASKAGTNDSRKTQVRLSPVHGKGVFALRALPAGSRIFEYVGAVITWPEALRRHPHDPSNPNHTFYFHIDENHVIDGNEGGNSARWINHSCDPNCEAEETDGRVFVNALRNLQPGDELSYDYRLMIEARYTPKLKKEYECRCGSRNCRRTMLAPKRG